MRIRSAARGLSVFYLLTGILSLIPPLVLRSEDDEELVVEVLAGRLFGLFPTNAVHAAAHVLFGGWGLVASGSRDGSRNFSRAAAISDGLLALLGTLPWWRWRTLFGLMPIYGNDVWLHALAAAVGGYFGWIAPAGEARAIGAGVYSATHPEQEAMGL
jgi:hypothetical protein